MKKVWKIAGGTIVMALALYVFLGGFSSIEMELVHSNGYQIQGKMFEGKYNAHELEAMFFEMKSLADSTGAQFAIINFDESLNEETGDIKQFVGLISGQTITSLDTYTIAPGEHARATLTAHNFVMPKPAAVRKSLQKLSDIPLEAFSIEIYSQKNLIIEIPIQAN